MKYTVLFCFVVLYFYSFKNDRTFLTKRTLYETFNKYDHQFYKNQWTNEKKKQKRNDNFTDLPQPTHNRKDIEHLKKQGEKNGVSFVEPSDGHMNVTGNNKRSIEQKKEKQTINEIKTKNSEKQYNTYSNVHLNEITNEFIEKDSDVERQNKTGNENTKEKTINGHNLLWKQGNGKSKEQEDIDYENQLPNENYINRVIRKRAEGEKKHRQDVAHDMLSKNLNTMEKTEVTTKNQRDVEETKKRAEKEHFLFEELTKIDYSKHGNNWNVGTCKIGKFQSPVDLHTKGLKERDLKNITDIYLNVFNEDEFLWNTYNKPWYRGDIFYYYEHLIKQLIVNRKNNIFQIKAANNNNIPFGVLFTTDTPRMFYADQIHFHSPSEHTFQGSGNRREIEMQIFHYTNDIYLYDEDEEENVSGEKVQGTDNTGRNKKDSKQKKETETGTGTGTGTEKEKNDTIFRNMKTKNTFGSNDRLQNTLNFKKNKVHSYFISFLKGSISNPKLEKKYMMDSKNKKGVSRYEVLSITFTSAEIDKTTLEMFQKLPSERFLRTILKASAKVPVGSNPQLVDLEEPLNLDALMMMLNVENMQFLSYRGSLTVPACDENVHWKVAKQALPVSTELMLEFYKMLNDHTPDFNGSKADNYRQLQNVKNNEKNFGKLYIIQGFPLQVLISSALSTVDDREVVDLIKDVNTTETAYDLRLYFSPILCLLLLIILYFQ